MWVRLRMCAYAAHCGRHGAAQRISRLCHVAVALFAAARVAVWCYNSPVVACVYTSGRGARAGYRDGAARVVQHFPAQSRPVYLKAPSGVVGGAHLKGVARPGRAGAPWNFCARRRRIVACSPRLVPGDLPDEFANRIGIAQQALFGTALKGGAVFESFMGAGAAMLCCCVWS